MSEGAEAQAGGEEVRFSVNGQAVATRCHPMARLLDVLREDLHLTGTKEGCGEGECGACAVIIDGALINSCLVPAAQVAGAQVRTVEGLAAPGTLTAVQEAFVQYGGAQCGICTPGMLLAATCLLERNPDPDEAAIRQALAGNLCRCTGYMKIFEAVLRAAQAAAGQVAAGPADRGAP
jgi:aerobic carbon-monoxide dehydrogenase small subunit